ncbi:MFS transporter [Algoriphagus sp. H41]|uniref:MFS transporter n=1 Tax=Algoriphagus oliviformis TaxID=2811231 RepID=A0ABS3C966_9BACT|nr:MFS transporter [Algoriphagus oliviformis]MBN7813345.1 MFS transporter [Algoriphagus oliviformis]
MNPYKRNAYFYSTIVAIGGFIFGLDAAVISGTVKFILVEFALTDLQLGAAVSAPVLGVLFALPLAGISCTRYGRKTTLQIVAVLYLVSAIASAFAPSFLMLVIARFVGGLAFSSISLASMYIGEISPPQWRGKLVAMIQINIVLGLSAAYFLNYLIVFWAETGGSWVTLLHLDEYPWRWMLGVEVLPALAWLVLLFFIPRSPAWLLNRGMEAQARQSLQNIYPEAEVDAQLAEMKSSLARSGSSPSVSLQVGQIFGKPMRLVLTIALTMAIVQQATGINAIMFYAPTIIEQLGFGADAAFSQAIWFGVVSVVFTMVALVLIDRFGRRLMVLGGLFWIFLSLCVCAYGFHSARYLLTSEALAEMADIPNATALGGLAGVEFQDDLSFKEAVGEILGRESAKTHEALLLQKAAVLDGALIFAGILSFIAAFHFSVGPIMWVLFSEIFPIAIRGVAIPLFTLISSFTSYLVQQFFPWQLAETGATATFLCYGAIVLVGFWILRSTLRETKNLSLEDIERKLVTI